MSICAECQSNQNSSSTPVRSRLDYLSRRAGLRDQGETSFIYSRKSIFNCIATTKHFKLFIWQRNFREEYLEETKQQEQTPNQ